MISVDYNLTQLAKSKIFCKLDAASGFGQLPLHPNSQLLTKLMTPFGRLCFKRLPFGITSAPDIFQRALSQILVGIFGVICPMDNVLIHGQAQAIHDDTVHKVLMTFSKAGITLNKTCEFSKTSIKFLGHIIDEMGIKADPEKNQCHQKLSCTENVTQLQQFIGMVNQL